MKILNRIYRIVLLSLLMQEFTSYAQSVTDDVFKEYNNLNNKEMRLTEFKDNDDMLRLKLEQLTNINHSRKKHNVQPVRLDILASRVANKMALEAATNNFRGHFNLNGETPYQRYAFAGGLDHVTENAASLSFDSEDATKQNKVIFMKQLHDAFMAERAPNDGHKQNCIQRDHNYVGIGFAIYKKEIRYYEEYIDRYLEFGQIKQKVNPNTEVTIPIKCLNSKNSVYAVIAYYEPFPKSMKPEKISRIPLYNDFTQTQFIMLPPWEIPEKDASGFHPVKIKFTNKGLYYIQTYISDTPYKSGKATTLGKTLASGIVIGVE